MRCGCIGLSWHSLKSASNTRKGRSSTSKANRLKHKIIVPSSPGGARTPADVSKKGGPPRPLCVPLHQKPRSHATTPANADRSTKPKAQPSSSATPSSQPPSSQPPSSQPLSQEPLSDVTTPDKTVTVVASTYKPIPTAYGGVREQRVKYEHVMLRYGDWDSVRLRVYTYLGITLCASLLSNYILILYAIVVSDTVHESGRPNCGCNVSATHATARAELGKVDPHERVIYWRMISGILLGLTSPLLERFLGRRHCLLLFLGLNVVWALILSTQTRILTDLSMFGLCLGDTFVVFSCAVSLIESLPFHLRVIAPLIIPVANAIGTVFCLLLFEQVALQKVCYAAIGLYVVGMVLTFFVAEESLCHLIVRNRIEDVQNIVNKYEMELCEREGGEKKFHERAAKKIYEDIVFLDTDELSIFFFLRRFFKSNVVLETGLACFFAMASGLLDFEMYQSMAELFAGAYVLMCGKLIAWIVTVAVMLMTRNTHRVKVMSLLQCAILLLLAMKKMMVKFDKGNVCSDHQFVARSMFLFAILLSSLIDGLVMALQTTLFLNFLEAAPSILRMTSVVTIMIPISHTYHFDAAHSTRWMKNENENDD